MKQEIYIIKDGKAYLRAEANNKDRASDIAHEIEQGKEEGIEATAIYDTEKKQWWGYHKKGSAYILSK